MYTSVYFCFQRNNRLPLDAMKGKIESNLHELEKAGVVSHKDNYQALINSVVRVCILLECKR